jgi:hypothetical protein
MLPSQTLFVASKSRDADAAQIRLGGVIVGAPSNKLLDAGIAAIGSAIIETANRYPSIDRRLLISDVAALLGHRINLRVFGAIVGSKLRIGALDVVPCAALSNEVFRVIVASGRLQGWSRDLASAEDLVGSDQLCPINRIRDEVIGDAARGMWSAASHIAARLVLLGRAEYVDRFSIVRPRGLNAICDARS